jgi:hypothetical protein
VLRWRGCTTEDQPTQCHDIRHHHTAWLRRQPWQHIRHVTHSMFSVQHALQTMCRATHTQPTQTQRTPQDAHHACSGLRCSQLCSMLLPLGCQACCFHHPVTGAVQHLAACTHSQASAETWNVSKAAPAPELQCALKLQPCMHVVGFWYAHFTHPCTQPPTHPPTHPPTYPPTATTHPTHPRHLTQPPTCSSCWGAHRGMISTSPSSYTMVWRTRTRS